MTTAQASTFFAVLALACAGATAIVWVLALIRWLRPQSGAGQAIPALQPAALWLGWLVATVTTSGSLYYSLVAHFEPCELCWYQRICMYPMVVLLLVAAVCRDTRVWRYALPIAAVGVLIAGYHTQLQAFPEQQTFCSLNNPCTIRYVWEFGFISLPLMDLIALLFVITMVLVARTPIDDFEES